MRHVSRSKLNYVTQQIVFTSPRYLSASSNSQLASLTLPYYPSATNETRNKPNGNLENVCTPTMWKQNTAALRTHAGRADLTPRTRSNDKMPDTYRQAKGIQMCSNTYLPHHVYISCTTITDSYKLRTVIMYTWASTNNDQRNDDRRIRITVLAEKTFFSSRRQNGSGAQTPSYLMNFGVSSPE